MKVSEANKDLKNSRIKESGEGKENIRKKFIAKLPNNRLNTEQCGYIDIKCSKTVIV